MSSESVLDILTLTYYDVDSNYKRVSIENKHRKPMHTFGLQTLRSSMIRGLSMGDLFSNMYIIAVVGLVVQYLISGKGNGVAGWVLPVISLAVVTYLQLFVWLPKSHGSDLPIIYRSVNYLEMNTYTLVLVLIFCARGRYKNSQK